MSDNAHKRSATTPPSVTSPSSKTDAHSTAGDAENEQITAGTYQDIFTYSKAGEDLNWTKVEDLVKRRRMQDTIQARKDIEQKTSDEIEDMNKSVLGEASHPPPNGSGGKRIPTPPGVPPPGPEREAWLRNLHEAEADLRERQKYPPLSRIIAQN